MLGARLFRMEMAGRGQMGSVRLFDHGAPVGLSIARLCVSRPIERRVPADGGARVAESHARHAARKRLTVPEEVSRRRRRRHQPPPG